MEPESIGAELGAALVFYGLLGLGLYWVVAKLWDRSRLKRLRDLRRDLEEAELLAKIAEARRKA